MGGVEDGAGEVEQAWLSFRRCRISSCSRPQTPALDQIRNLRWAVDFDIPKHGGSARQAHPLTST